MARSGADPAHDGEHLRRVVLWARRICDIEGGRIEVVVPAAWLHDCVIVPKDSPKRNCASQLAAERATQFLAEEGYPANWLPEVFHAIEAHSFSANIPPRTLEAKIVQDADRLDAIGAVGLSRCLMLGGAMDRPLYDPQEPLPKTRTPDDRAFTIDHFYTKLLTLKDTMHTSAARAEAERRTEFLHLYLNRLVREAAPI